MRGRTEKRKLTVEKKALTYGPPPIAGLAGKVQQVGTELRRRTIARLEAAGLEPDQIVAELRKGHEGWTLDHVLELQGRGPDATPQAKLEYNVIREEIAHVQLIDFDAQLEEMGSFAMSEMRRAIAEEERPEIRFRMAKQLLQLVGITDVKRTDHTTNHTFPPEMVSMMRSLVGGYTPQPVDLSALMERKDREGDEGPVS